MEQAFARFCESGAANLRFGEDFFPNASNGESALTPARLMIADIPSSACYYDAPLNIKQQPAVFSYKVETTLPRQDQIIAIRPPVQEVPFALEQFARRLKVADWCGVSWDFSRERCEVSPQALLYGSTLATWYAGDRGYRGDIHTLQSSELEILTFEILADTSGAYNPSYNWRHTKNVDQAADFLVQGAAEWVEASYFPNSSVTYYDYSSPSGNAAEEEPAATEYQLWNEYLDRITGSDSDALTEKQKAAVRGLWERLREILGESLPAPQAGPVPGAVFGYVWEQGDRYVEIELVSESEFDWFFTNKSTGSYEGGDGCALADFAPRLLDHLRQLGR